MGARAAVLLTGAGAALWAFHAIRTGKLPPDSPLLAVMTAVQVGGVVVAVGSLLIRG